jgi:hypothetical protein
MKIPILMVILFFTGIGMHLLSPKNKLDVRLYYSVSEAEEFFSHLGPTESHNYTVGEILDLFFILNYSLICFLAFDSFFSGGRDIASTPTLFPCKCRTSAFATKSTYFFLNEKFISKLGLQF